jgi:putative tryptophan/tyrosine transport system substrate-binding protein
VTIDRRTFVGSIAGGLVIAQSLAKAQSAAPLPRVGILTLPSERAVAPQFKAFAGAMRDLGWLDGKNIAYRFVYANGDMDRLDALASELVAQRVELILAPSAPSVRAAQRATKTIPIVMGSVSNPVGNGFVASLAKPGGNITGVSNQQEDVLNKPVEILHEIAPGARRFAILLNETSPSCEAFWAAAQRACAALNLVAFKVVASAPSQFSAAAAQIVRQQSQAVVVPPDSLYLNNRAELQALMQSTRLPVAYGWREHVVDGGLLSYAPDIVTSFRHVATYVDKILKGARPADLPVEQPTKFDFVINLRAAKALGLTIPQSLLLRADEVIQ